MKSEEVQCELDAEKKMFKPLIKRIFAAGVNTA